VHCVLYRRHVVVLSVAFISFVPGRIPIWEPCSINVVCFGNVCGSYLPWPWCRYTQNHREFRLYDSSILVIREPTTTRSEWMNGALIGSRME